MEQLETAETETAVPNEDHTGSVSITMPSEKKAKATLFVIVAIGILQTAASLAVAYLVGFTSNPTTTPRVHSNMEQLETAETETADHTGDARITIPPEQPDYTANHAVHHPAQIEEEANATILMTVIIGIIQTAATPLLGYTSNQTTIRAKSHTLFLYSNVILTFVTCLLGAAILIMYLFCGRTPRYSRIVKILLLAEIGSFTLALFLGVIFYLATS
ncbi:hypothetical protein ACLOJK_017590 [Asimina triloba]